MFINIIAVRQLIRIHEQNDNCFEQVAGEIG
jgi:hypothetical protein